MRHRAILLVVVVVLVGGAGVAAAEHTGNSGELHVNNSVNATANYSSIQNAVNDANASDTIVVESGTYNESVTIHTPITLVGPNAGIAGYNSTRGDEATITQGVVINASGVTLDGFEVTSDSVNGIKLSEAPSNVTVTNNVVRDVSGGTAGSKAVGNGVNMQFNDAFEQTSTGIKVTNNLVTGITTDNENATGDADAIGVQLLPRGNDVQDLRIANNVIRDIAPGDAPGRSEARAVSIATQFTDTSGGTRGDYGQAINLTVEGNVMSNLTADFGRAIDLFEDGDGDTTTNDALGPVNFTITNNTIEKITSTDGGLPALSIFVGNYEHMGQDHRVQYNNFSAAVENFGSLSDPLNATSNWWGSSNGPTAASNAYNVGSQGVGVKGDVEFTPWLDAPFDSGGVEFAPVENLDQGSAHPSIQAAVDAASSGQTVSVGPGTYEENVALSTKNITLTGSGDISSDSGTAVDVKADGVTVKSVTISDADVGVHSASNTDDLTIQGTTIENLGDGSSSVQGVWIERDSENVTIRDNVIRNLSGGSWTQAIVVFGYEGSNVGTLRDLVIAGNEITDVSTTANSAWGMQIKGNITNLQVEDNVIRNVTDPDGATGVQLTTKYASTGIRNSALRNNTFDSAQLAVDVAGNSVPGKIDVHFNDFAGATDDIHVSATGTLNAEYNWFGDANATDRSLDGSIAYDPFLTAPPEGVSQDPNETTAYAHDLTIPRDGKLHSIAFPNDVNGTVEEVISLGRGEAIYAYNASANAWLTGADLAGKDISTLDAFLVRTNASIGEDLRIVVEYAAGSSGSPSFPGSASVEPGWNLVGAPQHGPVSDAYGASTGTIGRVFHAYAGPSSQPYSPNAAPPVFVAQPDEGDRVAAFTGYWVFMNEEGEIGAALYPGITAGDERSVVTGE